MTGPAVAPDPGALEQTCEVWLMDPHTARPSHLDLLSDAERQWSLTYRDPTARLRHTAAAALLKMVAAPHLGLAPRDVPIRRACPDCDRPHGRPWVGAGLQVSISHAGDRVAVAVSAAGPVGVDIERVDPSVDVDGMLPFVLAAPERADFARLASADRTVSFYRWWTRKESILKATGDGLRTPMTSIVLRVGDGVAGVGEFAGRPEVATAARVYDLAVGGGYVAAVTVLSGGDVTVVERDVAGQLTTG